MKFIFGTKKFRDSVNRFAFWKCGEYTLCDNAIPDSTIEFDGAERIGEEFKGTIECVTCSDCIDKIKYIRSLK